MEHYERWISAWKKKVEKLQSLMTKSTTTAGSHPVILIEKNITLPVCQNFAQKVASTYWRLQRSETTLLTPSVGCFEWTTYFWGYKTGLWYQETTFNVQSLNSANELRPTWLKLQMLAAFIVSFVNTMAVTNRIRTDSKIAAATAGLVSPHVSKESIKKWWFSQPWCQNQDNYQCRKQIEQIACRILFGKGFSIDIL
jgi:hypothetical protein